MCGMCVHLCIQVHVCAQVCTCVSILFTASYNLSCPLVSVSVYPEFYCPQGGNYVEGGMLPGRFRKLQAPRKCEMRGWKGEGFKRDRGRIQFPLICGFLQDQPPGTSARSPGVQEKQSTCS